MTGAGRYVDRSSWAGIGTAKVRPPISSDAERLVKAWTTWMRSEGSRPRQIEENVQCLWLFATYVDDPATATPEEVASFLGRPGLVNATRANYYSRLRGFFRYVIVTGHRDDDPMAVLKRPRVPLPPPRPISTEQLEVLLGTRMRRRTKMMFLRAAFQGLRAHEIAKIRGSDIDWSEGRLRVCGKGGKESILPLHPIIADEAETYPRVGSGSRAMSETSRTPPRAWARSAACP